MSIMFCLQNRNVPLDLCLSQFESRFTRNAAAYRFSPQGETKLKTTECPVCHQHDDPTAWAERRFIIVVSRARPVLDEKVGRPPLVVVVFVSWMDYWTDLSFIDLEPQEQTLCMFLLTFVVGKYNKLQRDTKQLQKDTRDTEKCNEDKKWKQRDTTQLHKTTIWLQIDIKRQQKETQIDETQNSHKVTTKRCRLTTKRHEMATNQLQRDATQL